MLSDDEISEVAAGRSDYNMGGLCGISFNSIPYKW